LTYSGAIKLYYVQNDTGVLKNRFKVFALKLVFTKTICVNINININVYHVWGNRISI